MNPKAQTALNDFGNTVMAADVAGITTALVAVENAVLKSNLEDSSGEYTSRDYLVGEANTRGLSWKLNLLRLAAAANFCQLMRIGIHGGNTRVLGTNDNIDATFAVYNALASRYEELSKAAFQTFSDGQTKGEGEPSIHRVGWVNQWLIDTPTAAFEAVSESREQSANSKTEALNASVAEKLAEVKSSFAPPKPEKVAKPKKEKKAKGESSETPEDASGEGETEIGSENAD